MRSSVDRNGQLFCTEERGSKFLRNVGANLAGTFNKRGSLGCKFCVTQSFYFSAGGSTYRINMQQMAQDSVRCHSGDKLTCISIDIESFFSRQISLCDLVFMGKYMFPQRNSLSSGRGVL